MNSVNPWVVAFVVFGIVVPVIFVGNMVRTVIQARRLARSKSKEGEP